MIESTKLPHIDKEELSLAASVGARMDEARNLCALPQTDAAALLGIDQVELRRIEDGLFGPLPLKVIRKAAEIYNVSADWLFGLSSDWEVGDEELRRQRDFASQLQRKIIENHALIIAKQIRQENKVDALSAAAAALGPAIQGIDDSFMRFWEKNQEFANMPGGSAVLGAIDRANAAAHKAAGKLVRVKCLPVDSLQAYPIKEPANLPASKRKQSNQTVKLAKA